MAETSALITVNYFYLIVYKNRVFSLEKRAEKLFPSLIAIFKWDNSNKTRLFIEFLQFTHLKNINRNQQK